MGNKRRMIEKLIFVLLSIVYTQVQNCDVVCNGGSSGQGGSGGGSMVGGGQPMGQMTTGIVAQPAAVPCVCGAGVGGGMTGGFGGGSGGGFGGSFGGFGGGGGVPGGHIPMIPPQPIPSISYYTSLKTTDTSDCSQTTLLECTSST